MVELGLLNGSSPLDKRQQEYDDCNDEEGVNEVSGAIAQKTNQPCDN